MKKLIIICLVLLTFSCKDRAPDTTQVARIDSLENEILSLKRANDTLSDHLMKKSFLTKQYPTYFDSIPEPEKFILKDLQQNPGLIPKDGVLGGTMRFTAVTFINQDLLLAEYEDGHIMGKAIYTFKMDRIGGLTYSLVGNIAY